MIRLSQLLLVLQNPTFCKGFFQTLKNIAQQSALFLSIEVNVDALLVSPVDQSVTYHVLFIEIKLPVLLSRQ